MTADDLTPHMRMAGGATPAIQTTDPQIKDVMTSVRHTPATAPALTGTVVLTCELHQTYPGRILSGVDGATAPAPPRDPNAGFLGSATLAGMHVILDIGDAPGFYDPRWNLPITADLVHRAASVEVRGTNPYGVARVRSDLAQALADREDSTGSAVMQ